MRESDKDITRLEHIEKCLNNISEFTDGISLSDIRLNKEKYYATVYNIMIIGEAANMLTKEFRANHQATQWRDIVNMRNIIVHGYYQVEPEIVWSVIKKDLPVLKQQIGEYIEELKKNIK